ncbi:MAG: carbohydrate ABC transporter substrate-binding protein [Lachnospiraceae bacterium]|nr:carbohydrate ABC transporter substrate-binding protein [Lachnospiraceae bacterium]
MKRSVIRILLIVSIFVLMGVLIYRLLDINMKITDDKANSVRKEKTLIRLSWWGNDDRHKYTMEGVDYFQSQNPDINVAYKYGVWNGYEKRTKVWMESHNEADVMQINYAWLNEYSEDGEGFYDLNELADYIDLDNFTEEEKAYGTKNGKLNALPIAMNTHVFYYNQDLLDEYGLSLPETWDDLFAMGKVLGKDDKYVLGMNKKQMFVLLVAYYEQKYNKQMFDEDGKFAATKDELKELIEFYKSMIDEHVLCPIDLFDKNKYMSGEIAGTMCWISDTNVYCDALADTGVNVSRCKYPILPGAKRSGWYIKPATMWAISAGTEHPEEAAMLLNYLLNDEHMVTLQQTEKGVPVSKAAIAVLNEEGLSETNEYKAIQDMNEYQDELHLIVPNIENESLIHHFKSEADEFIFDKVSSEEAADSIYNGVREVLSEQ